MLGGSNHKIGLLLDARRQQRTPFWRTTALAGQPVPAQAVRRYGAGPSDAGFCAWRNAVMKSASVFSSMSDTAI